MKININNYEAFLLDYLEGKLDSEQLSELSLFLSLHPELKSELESTEIMNLKSDDCIFKNKLHLRKLDFETSPVCEKNFNDFCIAYHENILTTEKVKELLNFSAINPKYTSTLNQFGRIKLIPQASIKFTQKRRLYHKSARGGFTPTHLLRIGTVAASIAIIVTIFTLVTENDNRKTETSAIQTSPVKTGKMVASTLPGEKRIIKKTDAPKIRTVTVKNEIVNKNPNINETDKINREELSLMLISTPQIRLLKAPDKINKIVIPENLTGETDHLTIGQEEENTSKLNTTVENTLEKIKKEVANFESFKDKKGNFSLVKLVQAGVSGFSKMTESNMAITEKTDSTGKITAYSFDSEIIKFQKNVRN